MKRIILCLCLFIFIRTEAQQINPVPDYVFSNKMSVGRNAVTDTAAYFSIGPRYGAIRGMMPPMVTDTASMSATKRNGLLIFSIQKNKYLYWDSVGAKWAEMAGTGGTAISSGDTASMLTPYTRGSGTTNYLPKFTGSRTFGNSQIFDNGTRIGINTTAPVAPFQIGNANYYPSDDPVLLLSRNVNNDGGMSGTNAHSISEASIITRSGNIAFAGIENRAKFSGTNSFNHYAGFQNGLKYSSTGTITNYFGYYDALSVDSGTVTNAYGIYLQDATKAASATLTNNYGIYIGDRTAGTNDWTIYSNSTANSYFKGQINASKIITNEGNTAANATAEIEIQTNSGSKADLRLYQLGNNYWDIQIPANQTYLSIGDISGTYMYLKNGGEVNIGSVTDAGAYALQVAGAIYNTTGAVLAASSGSIGIGTTSTAYKLNVAGSVGVSGGGNGYVFGLTDANTRITGDNSGGVNTYIDMRTNGANRLRIQEDGEILLNNISDAGAYALQVAGAIYNTTTITTGAPTGGSIKPWRLGEAATVSPTSPNRTIRVEIDGTVYYIHAKTTND